MTKLLQSLTVAHKLTVDCAWRRTSNIWEQSALNCIAPQQPTRSTPLTAAGAIITMGRLADEHLPEVVPGQQQPPQQYYYYQPQTPQGISPEETSASPLPQVVPDSSPELAQQRYYIESDKIPAYYDTAPKLPYEPIPTPVDQQQQQQQYYQPGMVSAISPNSSVPWQSFPAGGDDQANVDPEPPRERRICGLPKRRFIIIAVILGLVIIGAAIGGGVGGAMAARRSSDESEPPAETTSAPETTSSTDPAPTSSPPTTTAR